MAVSIIEQAARRLEELRRSGIEVPPGAHAGTAAAAAPGAPTHGQRVLREIPSVAQAGASPKTSRKVNIDLGRLAAMGYLTPEAPRARIADEFRVIKRPLLNNARGRPAGPIERSQLIMVTSSLPGEGKTFVAVNLAISLAMELDTTVLLVDADVSRPSVLNRLGIPSAPGLLDLLTDPSLGLGDVLLRTNIDKLSLLPAGKPQGRATELLASDAMNRLLDDLAARYSDRILIFDAPPLLPSPESRVLATHMGQVIVVVGAQQTPQRAVIQALAALDACPVVMPLLNKISRSEVGAYYGYYGPTEG
jgi:protein-tyrosine kinase